MTAAEIVSWAWVSADSTQLWQSGRLSGPLWNGGLPNSIEFSGPSWTVRERCQDLPPPPLADGLAREKFQVGREPSTSPRPALRSVQVPRGRGMAKEPPLLDAPKSSRIYAELILREGPGSKRSALETEKKVSRY